ncbi:MAG: response regulator [Chloroflexi bacterium]|nr:response regulator [Chloroflexota bacterium]
MHPINFLGLVSNMLLFMTGLSVAFIALWQNRRSRTNQLLALTMFSLSMYAIPNGLYYAIIPFDLDPRETVNWGSTVYMVASLSFFFFITELNDPKERVIAARARMIATVWSVIVLIVIWLDLFWTDPTLNDEFYRFGTQFTGIITFLLASLLIAYIGITLRNSAIALNRQILYALSILGIGLALFAIFGAPPGHVMHSVSVLIGVVMVSRVVLKDQLFNPLVELTDELMLKNRELEYVNKRKSEFLANMSHELRTPLNSIIGYTELVLNGIYGPLDDRLANRLEKVHKNGNTLLTLINDVLDLSKIDAGRLDLTPVHIAPGPLIDDIVRTLSHLAEEKNQKLATQYQDLPMIYVDEVRARQAILNVFANIIKFTGRSKSIHIGGYYDAVRNQVIVTMRASSGGIISKDAFKINQAIQDHDELASGEFADFGLGLAVSKRLVELHGGRIWFDERSSTMHMGFPAAAEVKKRQTIEAMKVPDTGDDDKRPLVLVIDDDPEAIEVMQGYLEPAGYRVFPALSGHEGILRARELSPSLITLDARMPGMDGWGVIDVLQEDEELKNVPVIMISVLDQSQTIKQFNSVYASLTKPLQRNALLETVEFALRTSVWKT